MKPAIHLIISVAAALFFACGVSKDSPALPETTNMRDSVVINIDSAFMSEIPEQEVQIPEKVIPIMTDSMPDAWNYKRYVDSARLSRLEDVEVYAMISRNDSLVRVYNNRWPEESIAYSLNILRDEGGRVRFFALIPTLAEGFMVHKHYFDAYGTTRAFERYTGFYGSECTPGVAKEYVIFYFDSQFKEIGHDYFLTDEGNKPLARELCKFPLDSQYLIAPYLEKLLLAMGIPQLKYD